MDWNVYPCICYHRLRPGAAEASQQAVETVWPLTERLVEREGYTVCGMYGDSEYAPPFCGGSEIRPGYESALRHARRIAAKLGTCTLIIGDASPIGDGDPFLPACEPAESNDGVHVRLVNFYLRPQSVSTTLRSGWRYFDRHRQAEIKRVKRLPLNLARLSKEIEVIVRRDPGRLLTSLYVTNPHQGEASLEWSRLLQQGSTATVIKSSWRKLIVPGASGAYLETIFQGDLPWVRQLRFKCRIDDRKMMATVHVSPSDMARDKLPLVWEDRG